MGLLTRLAKAELSSFNPPSLQIERELRRAVLGLSGDEQPLPNLMRYADEAGYEPALGGGRFAFHATPDSQWLQRADDPGVIDMNRGEAFGFHAGTLKSALDRNNSKIENPYYTSMILDLVAEPPSRQVRLPDMGNWSYPSNWRTRLDLYQDSKEVDGLSKSEINKIIDYTRHLENTSSRSRNGPEMRELMTDMGIDRINYRNNVEDPGSMSVVFLDPGKLRWGTRAAFDHEKKGMNGLLYGGGGVALGGGLMSRRRESD